MEKELSNYDKIRSFIFKNIILIIIFMVCAIYVVTGFVTIKETGKSIIEVAGESLFVFSFSYFVIEAFSMQGLMKGEESDIVVHTKKLLWEAKQKVNSKTSLLSHFLTEKNIKAEREYKNMLLCDYGLTYSDVLANNFDSSKFTKKELKKIALIKAKKIKKIFASEVLNDSIKRGEPMYLGKTKKTYFTQRNVSSLTTKIMFTLLFGYFTTAFIGFDLAEIIWKIFQVFMFIIFGIMEYFRAYLYMTNEYVELMQKKIFLLSEFEIYLSRGANYE